MAKVTAFTMLAIILATALPAFTYPTEYVVGDDSGWTSDYDYYQWLAGKTFYAGDTLIFNYDPTVHNVYVVDEDGYNNCDISNYKALYNTGNDHLSLPNPGTFYLICSYHCDYSDQKLQVIAN